MESYRDSSLVEKTGTDKKKQAMRGNEKEEQDSVGTQEITEKHVVDQKTIFCMTYY